MRNVRFIFILMILIAVSFISIGYAALNTELSISGNAVLETAKGIAITDIVLKEITDGSEIFFPEITDNSTNIGVNLPSSTSSFTYEVTISNNTNNYYYLSELNEIINSNYATYYIFDLYIYTEFPPNSQMTFTIIYEPGIVSTDTEFILNLEYVFTEGEIYKDDMLSGADPVLIDGLIPIVYDETIEKWKKADVLNNAWYDYSNLQWANAASVVSSKRAEYVSSPPGTIIEMSDITSMLVWIPRYSYTLRETFGYQGYGGSETSILTPGAYDIIFHSEEEIYSGSASYTGFTATNYYTSPAFCWGNSCDDPLTRDNSENVEIPGFWMAKFEASKVNNILYSKPNMTPMVQHSIAQTFYYVQDLMNGTNGYNNYGYVGYVDAHLIKNTEWGAMAYLSQSAYGKYGNEYYTGANKEIYPNNCSIYKTGIGGSFPHDGSTTTTCTTNTYETYYGMGASTTGNIYGVYDTVGGTFDRVMGTVLTATGGFYADKSGFTSLPEGRYINVYPAGNYGVNTTPSIRGDALTDTLGFYQDRGVTTEYLVNSWFYRGGSLWSNATYINGIFSYTTYSGIADPNHSSRYTITIY